MWDGWSGSDTHRRSCERQLKLEAFEPSESAEAAALRLAEFEAEWGKRYPAIGQIWRNAWEHVVPFLLLRRASAR